LQINLKIVFIQRFVYIMKCIYGASEQNNRTR
jgi:hypothetical protein